MMLEATMGARKDEGANASSSPWERQREWMGGENAEEEDDVFYFCHFYINNLCAASTSASSTSIFS